VGEGAVDFHLEERAEKGFELISTNAFAYPDSSGVAEIDHGRSGERPTRSGWRSSLRVAARRDLVQRIFGIGGTRHLYADEESGQPQA
jgi:hypothetical protein